MLERTIVILIETDLCSGVDSLLVSEWQRLEDIIKLLQPFALKTDLLQTDAVSLSNILPNVLDLECHLQQHATDKELAASMLRDMRTRFRALLQPDCDNFNPLPAAACLLEPKLAPILPGSDFTHLLKAAKLYIVSLQSISDAHSEPAHPNTSSDQPVALQRFAFLSAKLNAEKDVSADTGNADTVAGQLSRYLAIEGQEADTSVTALAYWSRYQNTYTKLVPISQDLLSAPASQAYVERILKLK